jgi:hypothetical protein
MAYRCGSGLVDLWTWRRITPGRCWSWRQGDLESVCLPLRTLKLIRPLIFYAKSTISVMWDTINFFYAKSTISVMWGPVLDKYNLYFRNDWSFFYFRIILGQIRTLAGLFVLYICNTENWFSIYPCWRLESLSQKIPRLFLGGLQLPS